MSHRVIYWTVGGVFAVLLVVMTAAWNYDRNNTAAQDKAQLLIEEYRAAGLPTPASPDQVAEVLGDDGGAVCATAGSEHDWGYFMTQAGVGGAFYTRPIIFERNMFEGIVLIVQTYCPEKLPAVRERLENLRFADD